MWIKKLARLGYATKGAVYIIIGILAVQVAFSAGGKTTDSEGVLHTIAGQPLGKILLTLIAIGLVGYALWRLIEAIKDTENKGSDAKGLATRLGYLLSGLVYGSLAFEAALLVVDAAKSDSGNSTSDWTALVLQQPFGRWLIMTTGAVVIGVAFSLFYQAYKTKFRNELNLREMDKSHQDWLILVSRFGIAARGVVFALIGFFLISAARKYDPSEARGLDGTLQAIAAQPFGKILLGLVALGLVAYGCYMAIQARYKRFPADSTLESKISV